MGDMIDEPKVLIPYDRREAISVRIAAALCGVSESTVRAWCEKHNIGRRVAGGPWQISRPALTMFLDGDDEALRQYQAGERAGRVAEYFRRAEAARRAELQCAQTPQTPQGPQLPQSASGALGSRVAILPRTSED